MSGSVFNATMFLAILPELWIFVLASLVLILDLALPKEQHRGLGWVTAIGLLLGIVVSLIVAIPPELTQFVWGDLLRFDRLGFVFSLLFMFGAAMTALISSNLEKIGQRGDFYVLMLVSTLGMCLMASAADVIMLYLAIETTSIPLYVLAGFYKDDDKSTEAGFKYLLFGAMTSAIMLFGFSYLFGLAGTTNLYELVNQVARNQLSPFLLYGVLAFILVGFAFKISAFPFHFWAPDVYSGAPTPIAGFLSTASKAAGFAVLVRVLWVGFPEIQPYWVYIMTGVSIATMTVGNLLALAQKDIKRLLAYSSIAHAGYALIGFVAVSELGATSVIFYLGVYLLTNLAAFGTVSVFEKTSGSSEIASFAGLSRRSPWLAMMMLVAFLSLAGMPPFGGFVTKFAVFAAAVQRGLIGLAVIGVLNSIVGLYYYLTVLKVIYLYRSEEEHIAVPIPQASLLALAFLSIGIIVVGIIAAPWFDIGTLGARALW